MSEIKCIACHETIHLPDEQDDDTDNYVICPHCKSIFEIEWSNPPVLIWADDPIVTASFRSYRKYIF